MTTKLDWLQHHLLEQFLLSEKAHLLELLADLRGRPLRNDETTSILQERLVTVMETLKKVREL